MLVMLSTATRLVRRMRVLSFDPSSSTQTYRAIIRWILGDIQDPENRSLRKERSCSMWRSCCESALWDTAMGYPGHVNCSRHKPGPKYFFHQGRIEPGPKMNLQWTLLKTEAQNPGVNSVFWCLEPFWTMLWGSPLQRPTCENMNSGFGHGRNSFACALYACYLSISFNIYHIIAILNADFKWLEHVGIQAWVYAPQWQTWEEKVLSCYRKGFVVSLDVRHELVHHAYLKEDQRSRGSQSKQWKL